MEQMSNGDTSQACLGLPAVAWYSNLRDTLLSETCGSLIIVASEMICRASARQRRDKYTSNSAPNKKLEETWTQQGCRIIFLLVIKAFRFRRSSGLPTMWYLEATQSAIQNQWKGVANTNILIMRGDKITWWFGWIPWNPSSDGLSVK